MRITIGSWLELNATKNAQKVVEKGNKVRQFGQAEDMVVTGVQIFVIVAAENSILQSCCKVFSPFDACFIEQSIICLAL